MITIVLVDDVDDFRALMRMNLELDGRFQVVGEARDGAEAVSAIADLQPHLALVDLSMPVMDGLAVIPEIHRVAPDTRVVVLSGFKGSTMRDEVLALSADDYLEKGISTAAMSERLEQVYRSPRKDLG